MGLSLMSSSIKPYTTLPIERARRIDDGLPIGVGLGISNGRQAAEVAGFADAVIVGSALVECLIDAEAAGGDGLAGLRIRATELAAGTAGQQA